MITTPVTAFPAYPAFPGRVATQGDAYVGQMPDLVTDVNAVNSEATATLADVLADQEFCETAQVLAESIAAATEWVSGTTYAVADAVWSPLDYQTYVRLIAGAGATDPSADITNWYCITARLKNARLPSPTFADGLQLAGYTEFNFVAGGTGTDVEGLTTDTLTVSGGAGVTGALFEHVAALAGTAIDCATGTYFTKTISGATTFTVANVPTGGYAMVLDLTNPGTNVTFFAGVDWGAGGQPSLSPSGRSLIGFSTVNGGINWTASLIAGNVL